MLSLQIRIRESGLFNSVIEESKLINYYPQSNKE